MCVLIHLRWNVQIYKEVTVNKHIYRSTNSIKIVYIIPSSVAGGLTERGKRCPIIFHIYFIGDRSGDHAGQRSCRITCRPYWVTRAPCRQVLFCWNSILPPCCQSVVQTIYLSWMALFNFPSTEVSENHNIVPTIMFCKFMDENAMEDVAPQIFILHGNDHHLHVELAVITELYRALFLYSDGSLLWHLHDDVARDSLATGK